MRRAPRNLLPLLLVAIVATAFYVGSEARSDIGVDFTPESLKAYVLGLGLKGPLIYLALVTFRSFLLLPSMVVLTAGGLVFGVAVGTLLGGAGLALSAVLKFTAARTMGREWLQRRVGARLAAFDERVRAIGPAVIALVTAHPMGVMTPFHWAAGFSSIPWPAFVVVVLVAGPLRAFAYSFFGASLLDIGSPRFWGATALLAVIALAPLAHPGLRRHLYPRRPESAS